MIYPTRSPITTANIRAHEAAMAGRIIAEDTKATRQPTRATTVVNAMAQTMREIGEGCTDKDLKRAGFSQAEIDRHGETASERAAIRARLN